MLCLIRLKLSRYMRLIKTVSKFIVQSTLGITFDHKFSFCLYAFVIMGSFVGSFLDFIQLICDALNVNSFGSKLTATELWTTLIAPRSFIIA